MPPRKQDPRRAAAERAAAALAASQTAAATQKKAAAAEKAAAENERALETLRMVEALTGPGREENERRYRAYFEAFDANGDGVLQRAEVAAALAGIVRDLKFEQSWSERQLDALFARCDLNGDGVLSVDEWRPVYNQVIKGALEHATKVVEQVRKEHDALLRKRAAAQTKAAAQEAEAAARREREREQAAEEERARLRREEGKAWAAPFEDDAELARRMSVTADAERARMWYPRGRYRHKGRDVLRLKCKIDPWAPSTSRPDLALEAWKEPVPSSAGEWEIFYVGSGGGGAAGGEEKLPAEQARALVGAFGFVQKYSCVEMDRNNFRGGERHFWPAEYPYGAERDYFNSG
tara:strand:+ start:88 stop:1137 length:1050 start_codon:yes stop_codon:yes gene_type:complete